MHVTAATENFGSSHGCTQRYQPISRRLSNGQAGNDPQWTGPFVTAPEFRSFVK